MLTHIASDFMFSHGDGTVPTAAFSMTGYNAFLVSISSKSGTAFSGGTVAIGVELSNGDNFMFWYGAAGTGSTAHPGTPSALLNISSAGKFQAVVGPKSGSANKYQFSAGAVWARLSFAATATVAQATFAIDVNTFNE